MLWRAALATWAPTPPRRLPPPLRGRRASTRPSLGAWGGVRREGGWEEKVSRRPRRGGGGPVEPGRTGGSGCGRLAGRPHPSRRLSRPASPPAAVIVCRGGYVEADIVATSKKKECSQCSQVLAAGKTIPEERSPCSHVLAAASTPLWRARTGRGGRRLGSGDLRGEWAGRPRRRRRGWPPPPSGRRRVLALGGTLPAGAPLRRAGPPAAPSRPRAAPRRAWRERPAARAGVPRQSRSDQDRRQRHTRHKWR